MSTPINELPRWPDSRGWIGIGVFGISIMLILMMRDRALREDEFFQTIATVIISNGLIAVIAWAYQATKGGGELADKNAAIVAESASASVSTASKLAEKLPELTKEPQPVEVVNTPANPANVTETPPADEQLPDYARG